MSCWTYTVLGREGKEFDLYFSSDDLPCLCCFGDGQIDAEHVRSLAMLGAAVALATHHAAELEDGGIAEEGTVFVPAALPTWVVEGIQAAVPLEDEDGEQASV